MQDFYTEKLEKISIKKAIAILLVSGSIVFINKWRNK
mgnify:CR=1 FL=1